MSAMASQINSLATVYSTVYSGADQRKHQSSASLAFVMGIHRWPVNSPHNGPVTRKMFPFDDTIMEMQNNTPIKLWKRQFYVFSNLMRPWSSLVVSGDKKAYNVVRHTRKFNENPIIAYSVMLLTDTPHIDRWTFAPFAGRISNGWIERLMAEMFDWIH